MDSEDLVQETLLRAWRKRDTYQARSSFRAWLYRIATNVCLDALERRRRRPRAAHDLESGGTPLCPDPLPDEIATAGADPHAEVASKETIELVFLAAIQHLPPRQRAVLILRAVFGWSATDAASLLDASVPSVNSALQRARRTLKDRLPEQRLEWSAGSDPSPAERALLQRYLEAIERADTVAFVEMLHEEPRLTMSPGRPRANPRSRGGDAWQWRGMS